MDPVTLSLLLSAGTAAVKGGIGAAQYAKGKKLAKGAQRPTYEIPQATEDYLKNAQAMALSSQLPGQKAIEEKIGASTASGIRAAREGASSSAGLMAAIGGLKGTEQSQMADVGIAGAQYQDANKQRLQQALLQYGTAQDKAFDINQMDPYYDKAKAAESLTGAGIQNIMTGIEGLGGAAALGAGSKGQAPSSSTGAPSPSTLGGARSTSLLGGSNRVNTLGSQSNVQKYLNARSKGFQGDYNTWISSNQFRF